MVDLSSLILVVFESIDWINIIAAVAEYIDRNQLAE